MSGNADLFFIISQLENENYSYFAEMSEETLKEVSPFVIMLWSKGASRNSKALSVTMDEFVNQNHFLFYNHKRLQMLLLCSAWGGIPAGRLTFPKKSKAVETKSIQLISDRFKVSDQVARSYLPFFSETEIEEMLSISDERAGKAKK